MKPIHNLRAIKRNTAALVIQCLKIAAKGQDHRAVAMRGKAKRLRSSIQGHVNSLAYCWVGNDRLWPMVRRLDLATDDVLAACRRVLNGGTWDGDAAWSRQDMALNLLMREKR
jgi:hypothetical protein